MAKDLQGRAAKQESQLQCTRNEIVEARAAAERAQVAEEAREPLERRVAELSAQLLAEQQRVAEMLVEMAAPKTPPTSAAKGLEWTGPTPKQARDELRARGRQPRRRPRDGPPHPTRLLHVRPLPELRVVWVVLVVVVQGGLPQGTVALPHPPRSVANQLGETKKQILCSFNFFY